MKRQKGGFPRKKSLFFQYFGICLSIILVSTTLLGSLFFFLSARYFQQEQYQLLNLRLGQAVSFIESKATPARTEETFEKFSETYHLLSQSLGVSFVFFDQQGHSVSSQPYEKDSLPERIDLPEPVINELNETGIYQQTAHFESSTWYSAGEPIILEGETTGYLFVFESSELLKNYLNHLVKVFLLADLLVLAASSLILLWFVTRMVRPLREMAEIARAYGKGDFSNKITLNRTDEIGELASALNSMGTDLALLEESRRSFVANVSHELRTPMTSIVGFIDGILDGAIPENEQTKYLHIVSEEAKRLARMVQSMLQLSRIEAGELSISCSNFSVDSLLLPILLSFEGTIQKKQVQIIGLDQTNITLYADRDLIYQVFYNLIENAVKFVNDGGEIRFESSVLPKAIKLSVVNTGAGLSKEERLQVFNRFYKTDRSRGLDRTGVGLGLNIVQKIVQLHEGTVEVFSQKGKYTGFQLTFPQKKHTVSGKTDQNNSASAANTQNLPGAAE